MNADGFEKWLNETQMYKKEKMIKDCVSRAKRVEKAFQAVDATFSYESEYEKDKGAEFKKKISRRGVELTTEVPLPIGTNQMDSIASAAKKYFAYMDATNA